MTTPTHIIIGGMTAYLVTTTPLCIIMCVLGSILPDIDNKGSLGSDQANSLKLCDMKANKHHFSS